MKVQQAKAWRSPNPTGSRRARISTDFVRRYGKKNLLQKPQAWRCEIQADAPTLANDVETHADASFRFDVGCDFSGAAAMAFLTVR